MKFGQKKKDAPDVGSGKYLRNWKKGETKVRFLDESDDWIAFREHYTRDRKSFPCTEERDTCLGCQSPDEEVAKSSRKYAAQVLLVKQNQVLPFRIPVTLADRLAIRAERNGGTLLNRDYVVIKSGSGFDTEYDVDQEDKYPVDLAELHNKVSVDIQEALQESWDEVWGEAKSKGRHEREDDEKPAATEAKADEDEEVTLTEEQIRAMDKPELQSLCDKAGIKYTDDDSKSELIEKILNFGS